MSFLYPGLLAALGVIAIPIIIHLFYFRRYKTVYFSNLRFLKQLQEQTASRNQLKHLLILISRILAFTFLVLAFVQPYIPSGKAGEGSGPQGVSIYIDNSFSMGNREEGVSLLQSGITKAEEIIRGYGVSDRFQVLTNRGGGKEMRFMSREEALDYLTQIKTTPAVMTLAEVKSTQERMKSLAPGGELTAYWISDFQSSIVDFTPDSSILIYLVVMNPEEATNVYIDTAWIERPSLLSGQETNVYVTVKNNGRLDIENGSLSLKEGDKLRGLSDFTVAAGSETTDTLQATITEPGWHGVSISLQDNPITFDDSYFLNLKVEENIPVAVVNDGEENKYVKTAIGSIEKAAYTSLNYTSLDYQAINTQKAIIISGITSISTGLSSALAEYIDQGGVVVVFCPENMSLDSYQAFFNKTGVPFSGSKGNTRQEISRIETDAPILKDMFVTKPENIQFPEAKNYYLLSETARTEVLLRLKDGTPYLTMTPSGKGKVYLIGSHAGESGGTFHLHALFAPFLYKMIQSGGVRTIPSFTIGDERFIEAMPGNEAENEVIRMKGEAGEIIPRQVRKDLKLFLDPGPELTEAGIYDLTDAGGKRLQTVAMNYDRKESDMTFSSAEELENNYSNEFIKIWKDLSNNLSVAVKQDALGSLLWKWCLALALFFLLLETLLLRMKWGKQ